MGDVAMTVPVVYSLAIKYPEIEITMLVKQRFLPFYAWMPKNVKAIGLNLDEYNGVSALNKLYNQLKLNDYDAVADIHDVLRTKYLRMRFRLSGTKIAIIDKAREEKKALIGHGLNCESLKPITERYREVFQHLGLNFDLIFESINAEGNLHLISNLSPHTVTIGVAPFAAHKGKIYPLDKMKEVVDTLADSGNQIFLFGAGNDERALLKSWERDSVKSVVENLGDLQHELILMSKLNLMISMDSSNMHMAAIMGTQTISIWGATHPKAGFVAWHQTNDSIIQVPMECRPCSIYGNKPCHKGDYPCMQQISTDQIIQLARKYGAK